MFYWIVDYLRWRAERPLLSPHDSWPVRKAVWKSRRPRSRRRGSLLTPSVAYYYRDPPKQLTWDDPSSNQIKDVRDYIRGVEDAYRWGPR